MNVNQVAFCTGALLSLATTACVLAAATTTAGTVATVAYAILALGFGGAATASVTAWFVTGDKTDVNGYFTTLPAHMGYAMTAMFQAVAQVAIKSLIQGIGDGISKALSRKIGGEDVTVSHRQVPA